MERNIRHHSVTSRKIMCNANFLETQQEKFYSEYSRNKTKNQKGLFRPKRDFKQGTLITCPRQGFITHDPSRKEESWIPDSVLIQNPHKKRVHRNTRAESTMPIRHAALSGHWKKTRRIKIKIKQNGNMTDSSRRLTKRKKDELISINPIFSPPYNS